MQQQHSAPRGRLSLAIDELKVLEKKATVVAKKITGAMPSKGSTRRSIEAALSYSRPSLPGAAELDVASEELVAALATLRSAMKRAAAAGVRVQSMAEDLSRADWEWVYGVNVFGTAALVRRFLPQLRRSTDARILITASTSALYPCSHMSAYVSSKYALLGYTETLRMELADEGIGVTAMLPGPMATTHLASSEAAKPDIAGHPVHTPDTIAVIAQGAGGETIDADTATRNVLDDLAKKRPYVITHHVHTEPIEARYAEIRQAFELARR